MIGYPPLPDERGVPLISQNRQFQWFNKPTYIYPCIPAYAATLLQQEGHQVFWEDGIAQEDSVAEWNARFARLQPDVLAIEVKTPVVKRYWKYIDELKARFPRTKYVLMGDHITALPRESLENCQVDYCLTGGDYDFALKNLCAHLDHGEVLEPGVYFWRDGTRQEGDQITSTGLFELKHSLDTLPMVDRHLTKWQLYARENGNFKYFPGTYTMVGRDCWWGRCTFCSWTTTFPNFRCRTPQQHADEIGHLIELGVKEVFDDTGTFPTGGWLKEFCQLVLERGYHKKITLGCNMIPGVLSQEEYDLMGRANFRFMLFGLESANQTTLDHLHKLGCANTMEDSMRMAKQGGLMPHVTCMVGYPWESKAEAQRTIDLTRHLFQQGFIDTLQATICMPYPGTPLFKECKENGWLRTEDWDDYSMRDPIMKCPIPDEELLALSRGLYTSFLSPRFIWQQLRAVRSWSDVIYLARGGWRVLGHILDFNFGGIGRKQTVQMRRSFKGTDALDEALTANPAPEPRGRVTRPLPPSRARQVVDSGKTL